MCLSLALFGLNSIAAGFQEKKMRFWSIPGSKISDRTKADFGKVIGIKDDVADGYVNVLKTQVPPQIVCGHDKYDSYIFSEYHALSFKFKDANDCMKVAAVFAGTSEETPFDVTGRWISKGIMSTEEYFQVVNVGPALGKVE